MKVDNIVLYQQMTTTTIMDGGERDWAREGGKDREMWDFLNYFNAPEVPFLVNWSLDWLRGHSGLAWSGQCLNGQTHWWLTLWLNGNELCMTKIGKTRRLRRDERGRELLRLEHRLWEWVHWLVRCGFRVSFREGNLPKCRMKAGD